MGVRHLAMEALQPGDTEAADTSRRPPEAAGGYLAQPDMRDLIQAALGVEEAGPLSCWPGVDALIVSTDNAMT
jgi:hypothetical protein